MVNLRNGDEAMLDEEALDLLVSVSYKADLAACNAQERELLEELEKCMELKADEGVFDLVIKEGDFSNLDIDLVNTCNRFCRHCFFYKGRKRPKEKFVDYDILKRTIIEAEEMGLYKLKLCGGEPLTYYMMLELLLFLAQRPIMTAVVCNGLLLDKFLDKLDSSKLSFVISLDGFQYSHDYLRGEGSYALTKSNIEKAIAKGFHVEVNMVVYDRNLNDVEAFAEMVKVMGVRKLNVQVIRPLGQAKKRLKGALVTDEDFLRKMHQNELEAQVDKIAKGESFCTSCKTGLTIDYNHDVISCALMPENPVGNLKTEGLKDIYERSLEVNPLLDVGEKAECLGCELFMVSCAGGCRARAKKMTGSLYGCDYWIPFLLRHPKFHEGKREAWEYLMI